MDNTTLWRAVLSAGPMLRQDFQVGLLPIPPGQGTPTLTLWSECDLVLRFAHYLVAYGQVPLDWLHREASLSGRSDDPDHKKLDSGRRVDLVLVDPAKINPAAVTDWQGRLFIEAKIVLPGNHGNYSYSAVEQDAIKLQHHVQLRRADGGVLLVYNRQKGSGFAPLYHQLATSRGLGALVHFEYCPSEDVEFAPPGF